MDRCILCGWIDDGWGESEADDVRPPVEPCFPEGRKSNGGYSLTDARRNFIAHGHMFRPDDLAAEVMEEQAPERESLRRLFDDLLETSKYDSNSRWLEDSRGIRRLGGREKNVFVNFRARIQHNGHDFSSDG